MLIEEEIEGAMVDLGGKPGYQVCVDVCGRSGAKESERG